MSHHRAALALVGLLAASAAADPVDVRLEPSDTTACVGDVVELDLVLVTDGASAQPIDALDAVLSWDPSRLMFLGNDDSDAGASWFISDFLPDPDDVNDSLTDGDAIYTAFASPGTDVFIPPAPGEFVVTTFQFLALAETPATEVELLPTIGAFGVTQVLDDGGSVTGTIAGPVDVTVQPSCPGDCSVPCDGVVDVVDLLALLAEWGLTGTPCDIAGTSTVDVVDLLELLAEWGPCS